MQKLVVIVTPLPIHTRIRSLRNMEELVFFIALRVVERKRSKMEFFDRVGLPRSGKNPGSAPVYASSHREAEKGYQLGTYVID
jgi:hypothetical protein